MWNATTQDSPHCCPGKVTKTESELPVEIGSYQQERRPIHVCKSPNIRQRAPAFQRKKKKTKLKKKNLLRVQLFHPARLLSCRLTSNNHLDPSRFYCLRRRKQEQNHQLLCNKSRGDFNPDMTRHYYWKKKSVSFFPTCVSRVCVFIGGGRGRRKKGV